MFTYKNSCTIWMEIFRGSYLFRAAMMPIREFLEIK